mmetsp:Transcript_104098/g.224739  ORF Transcript_104098/g.224739 Transcript_104098/m.224739 type:complete len:240 (-) Transcript_104098:986-1705(-)
MGRSWAFKRDTVHKRWSGFVGIVGHNTLSRASKILHGESIALVDLSSWGGDAIGVHTEASVRVLSPAVHAGCLHRHDGHASGENLPLVLQRLSVKELPARHRHNTHSGSALSQSLGNLHSQLNFSPGGSDDQLGRGGRSMSAEGVGTHRHLLGTGAFLGGRDLSAQRDHRGTLAVLHGADVGTSHLVSVGRAEDEHVGHGAEGFKHLHWLVCGAIFSESDGVVSHHVDHSEATQSGQSH